MEQDFTCQNHVQCDIYPTTLTCDVVLPSYQYFLQYLQRTGMTRKSSSKSNALNQFEKKTIQMLILARVNGYYSPYSPQTIMEEEARSRYNDIFSIAEKEFFKHRLLTLYPKVSDKDIELSINFLEQQKMVKCPCFVYTEQRGHGWTVFRRQPDRKISDDALALMNAPMINDCGTEDEDFFSTEDNDHVTAPISDNAGKEDNIQDVSGASSGNDVISSDHSYISKASEIPEEGQNIHATDRHSRETNQMNDENQPDKIPLDCEDNKTEDEATTGKTYYYKYFKPHSHVYRRPRMEEECQCPKGELHSTKCTWYNPNTIYILDIHSDLSPNEQAAQQKIYHLYLETLNTQTEQCACGTAAKIAYMGHHTECIKFQYNFFLESWRIVFVSVWSFNKMG